METKIGTHYQFRSSFSSGGSVSARRNVYTNSAKTQSTNADTFTKSLSPSSDNDVFLSGLNTSDKMREQLRTFSKNVKNAKQLEPLFPKIETDTNEGKTKFNFEWISMSEKSLNESIPKRLEKAGVPKDVTFEFDYSFKTNFSKIGIEITEISDENYREAVNKVLEDVSGPFTVISLASRVMNGYASSLYYPCMSNTLNRRFGQNMDDFYIDENGNLGGINKKLQTALNNARNAEKRGEYFSIVETFGFSAKSADNIVNIIKRLVSEKNAVTPNISHMGYDGEQLYTNDGEFRFGKDFDPNLFDEEKYIMRGPMALFMSFYGNIGLWAENCEK